MRACKPPGFSGGPRARHVRAVLQKINKARGIYYLCRVSSCLSVMRYKLGHMGAVTASPLASLCHLVGLYPLVVQVQFEKKKTISKKIFSGRLRRGSPPFSQGILQFEVHSLLTGAVVR